MTSSSLLQRAVLNNARWCDLVCRSHAVRGEFSEGLWSASAPAPRFYPNAVTLQARLNAGDLTRIAGIAAQAWNPGIKDSFAALDLAEFGLEKLFEAEWLARSAAAPVLTAESDRIWRAIEPADLERWELSWSDAVAAERVFHPPLLDDRRVRIFAGYEAGEIVAGGIAFLTDSVVGVSNIFCRSDSSSQCWTDFVAAASAEFPGLDLVCYESGETRRLATDVGFDALGPLRVWAKSNSTDDS
jgi:hypothetical protein